MNLLYVFDKTVLFEFAGQVILKKAVFNLTFLCYFFFPGFPWIFEISKWLFWILVLHCTCKLQQYLVYLLKIFKHLWGHYLKMGSSGITKTLWWSLKNTFLQLFSTCQPQKLVLQNIYQKSKYFKHFKPWNWHILMTWISFKSWNVLQYKCQNQIISCKFWKYAKFNKFSFGVNSQTIWWFF